MSNKKDVFILASFSKKLSCMQNRNTYFEPPLERNVKVSLFCFCTGGTHGDVSVRVRTIGGGESWQGSVTLRPSDVSNTIENALANTQDRPHATAGLDYREVNMDITFRVS